uniref:Bacteriophage T5 Orf172 DNA-binding domain-containing protein n=1 Tax=Siphoviridae sp. ctREU2 TaxID=2826333 RepID=A0A8S5NK16_9CAUD|nr:MAG TPA: hypothetical protein [Siphoviridae sp. ctREU2]
MLYLIESGNYVKIGYAKDIDKRMLQYATHNPNFSLVDATYGELSDEKDLHRILKPYRYINEWYYFNKEVALVWLDYVKKQEPKMCAYDYSGCGGRTEGWKPSILYEIAEEWEEKLNDCKK